MTGTVDFLATCVFYAVCAHGGAMAWAIADRLTPRAPERGGTWTVLSIHAAAAGPRLAVIKIDDAEKERVLAHRDGNFLVSRVRQTLGFQPI